MLCESCELATVADAERRKTATVEKRGAATRRPKKSTGKDEMDRNATAYAAFDVRVCVIWCFLLQSRETDWSSVGDEAAAGPVTRWASDDATRWGGPVLAGESVTYDKRTTTTRPGRCLGADQCDQPDRRTAGRDIRALRRDAAGHAVGTVAGKNEYVFRTLLPPGRVFPRRIKLKSFAVRRHRTVPPPSAAFSFRRGPIV